MNLNSLQSEFSKVCTDLLGDTECDKELRSWAEVNSLGLEKLVSLRAKELFALLQLLDIKITKENTKSAIRAAGKISNVLMLMADVLRRNAKMDWGDV